MSFNQYYRDELSFLREMGAEFSDRFPALAPLLGKSSTDPDVERLLEGFAFLGGRIRQKLDDEFPEIVASFLNVLYPQFLRPFPSASILQFRPMPNRLSTSREVPANALVQTQPAGDVTCSFRTCGTVAIHPLALAEASLDPAGLRLTLKFEAFERISFSQLDIERLRIYVAGDSAFEVYKWLSLLVRRCRLTMTNAAGTVTRPLPNPVHAGFDPALALVPFPAASFQGYRLLQEYMLLPEKFLFLDFVGLRPVCEGGGPTFSIECEFEREAPRSWRLSRDNFRLFCVPVVNLFTDESNPVDVNHERREYRLIPTATGAEIYSVAGASAWVSGTAQSRPYQSFPSLEQDPEVTYYSVQTKLGIDGETRDTNVCLSKLTTHSLPPPRETAVFSLLCTNGRLATQVKVGAIDRATDSSPEYARFTNISRVSAYQPVSADTERQWQLLSSLLLSPSTLNDVAGMRALLRLYNCPEEADARLSRTNIRKIEAITQLRAAAGDFIVTPDQDPERRFRRRYGLPIRGTAVHMTVQGSNFSGDGDLYLFGTVLSYFFSQYATLNSLTQLTLSDLSTGSHYSWPPRIGEQIAF